MKTATPREEEGRRRIIHDQPQGGGGGRRIREPEPQGGGGGARSAFQSGPREEEGAEPKPLGDRSPEFRVRRPQGGGRGRRHSDRLREEEEPFELCWDICPE